jgi:hypothetical protein
MAVFSKLNLQGEFKYKAIQAKSNTCNEKCVKKLTKSREPGAAGLEDGVETPNLMRKVKREPGGRQFVQNQKMKLQAVLRFIFDKLTHQDYIYHISLYSTLMSQICPTYEILLYILVKENTENQTNKT